MNFHGDMAITSLRNWKTQNLRTYNFEIAQDGSKKDFFDYFFLQNYSFLYQLLFPKKFNVDLDVLIKIHLYYKSLDTRNLCYWIYNSFK